MKTNLVAWLLAFFSPIIPLTLLVGFFIMFDTYMGRKAAKVVALRNNLKPREVVTSRKTRVGLFKKLFTYNMVLLSIYMIDLYILGDVVSNYSPFPLTITRLGVVVLCWVEYDSIDEKYYRIHKVTLTSIIKEKIDKIKEFIKSITIFKNDLPK